MSDPEYLSTLTADEARRAELVQSLTAAACILMGRDSQWYGARLHCQSDAEAFRCVQHGLALRQLAQRLCGHARLAGDGSCRYCEAVMACEGA